MNSEKRNRGKNYSAKEKRELLKIVEKYASVIESKETDKASLRRKQEAWNRIAAEFNSRAEEIRDSKQVKTAYINIKRRGSVTEVPLKGHFDDYCQYYHHLHSDNGSLSDEHDIDIKEEPDIEITEGESFTSDLTLNDTVADAKRQNNYNVYEEIFSLKKQYYQKKIDMLKFELKCKKELHELDMEYKTMQLKVLKESESLTN